MRDKIAELLATAKQAHGRAYAPYSGFKVGAAVLGDDDKIYMGCNTENISYPCGSCAEQNAVGAFVCGGGHKIKAVLVMADSIKTISPCGACLQRINEFADKETTIYLADLEKIRQTYSLRELLPNAFNDLEINK